MGQQLTLQCIDKIKAKKYQFLNTFFQLDKKDRQYCKYLITKIGSVFWYFEPNQVKQNKYASLWFKKQIDGAKKKKEVSLNLFSSDI